jgi:hypothetical protein
MRTFFPLGSDRLRRILCAGGVVVGIVVAGFGLVSQHAEAAPSTPSLTITPSASGHPYVSGQSIRISVGPNSRFTAYSRVEVLECAASNGTLPVDDTACDGNTAQLGSVLVAADGSFDVPAYTLYQLPNSALGEPANHAPACDRSQECVLYIGQNQNDFSQPKMFSGTFAVDPSTSPVSAPSGSSTAAGAGTPGPAGSGASGAGSHGPSKTTTPVDSSGPTPAQPGPSSPATGVLAYTGIADIPWLVSIGIVMVLLGMAGTLFTRGVTA